MSKKKWAHALCLYIEGQWGQDRGRERVNGEGRGKNDIYLIPHILAFLFYKAHFIFAHVHLN